MEGSSRHLAATHNKMEGSSRHHLAATHNNMEGSSRHHLAATHNNMEGSSRHLEACRNPGMGSRIFSRPVKCPQSHRRISLLLQVVRRRVARAGVIRSKDLDLLARSRCHSPVGVMGMWDSSL
jgi:hypothetical protein